MKTRYHHGDLREALLDAVLAEVQAGGVDGVKVSALARRCGVSSAAPFKHFGSRLDILVAAAERAADQQLEAMGRAAAAVSDPGETQRAAGVAYVRWAVENPGAFRLLASGVVFRASERLQAQSAAFREQLDATLGEARPGEVTPALTERTAGALAGTALVYGLAKLLVDGQLGERTPEEAAQIAHEVTALLGG